MNRECHGDYFKADGVKYYRCFLDGRVAVGQKEGEPCTACNRPVKGQDHGVVELEEETKTWATITICGNAVKVYI